LTSHLKLSYLITKYSRTELTDWND